ncbi:MAG: hypothetical protein NZM30_08065 [Geminocystis sp.]|nr:hypothetical protein [Geminocystis sp.]
MNTKMLQLVKHLQTYSHFFGVWFLSLIVAVLILVLAERKGEKKRAKEEENGEILDKKKVSPPKGIWNLFVGLFLGFLGLYIYLIFYEEDFAYLDNAQLNSYSLIGKFTPLPIGPEGGRFWPFGLQEYNIISLISKSPTAYHLLSVIQLIVILWLCWKILPPARIYRLIILTLLLIQNTFVLCFFNLIYPERNIIFFLAVFIYSLVAYQRSGKLIYQILAVISAQFMLYYKEPVFIMLAGFSLGNLFWNWVKRKSDTETTNLKEFIRRNSLNICLLWLAIVYFTLYVYYTWGKVEIPYNKEYDREAANFIVAFFYYLKVSPTLSIFLLFFSWRCFQIAKKRAAIEELWDFLALGVMLYLAAYLKLKLAGAHYMAPGEFVAILYVSQLGKKTFNWHQKAKRFLCITLLAIFLIVNIPASSYRILFRKKYMEMRREIAGFIGKRMKDNPRNIVLFFPPPYESPYNTFNIMEFVSYLNYKGFPVLKKGNEEKGQYIITKAPEKFPENLCFPGSGLPFQCFFASQPGKNDLIVFLTATPVTDEYQQKADLLFHYQPQFRGIERVLYLLAKVKIDKQWRWLNGYVFSNSREANRKK